MLTLSHSGDHRDPKEMRSTLRTSIFPSSVMVSPGAAHARDGIPQPLHFYFRLLDAMARIRSRPSQGLPSATMPMTASPSPTCYTSGRTPPF